MYLSILFWIVVLVLVKQLTQAKTKRPMGVFD
jgi:hypothetical protein